MCQLYQQKNMGKTYLKEISPWEIITNLTGELILRDIFTESTVSIRKFNWGKIHNGELSDEILYFTMMCPARKYFGCFPKWFCSTRQTGAIVRSHAPKLALSSLSIVHF